MKSCLTTFLIFLFFGFPSPVPYAQNLSDGTKKIFLAYPEAIEHSEQKLKETLTELNFDNSLHPAHTDPATGKWDVDAFERELWTSGFFSGSMWYMYKLTGEPFWRDSAIDWTKDLEPLVDYGYDHDMGFRIFNSFGNAHEIMEGHYYFKVILQGAFTLSKRYDRKIGAIKSWEWIGNYPVIIDNLMNLEMLFWAAERTGRSEWHEIALDHAETTLEHHLRDDGTTYHIVDFDDNGSVNWKDTRQGYGPESVWARGQAWAIYGFTMIYRYTNEPKFLEAAEKTALYFIENLPDDYVPPYDFLEPEPSVRTKDASAAAITASALFELYSITGQLLYFNTAVEILNSLSTDFYSTKNSEMSSILKNSTIQRGRGNVGTTYADYYYLEAIIRYKELTDEPFPPTEKQSMFFLDQNYPNPFNNSTSIYYSIEQDGFVNLTVYNLAGRKVQTIVNRFRSSGNYRVDFDGSDLSSGLYLYRLSVNGKAETRKMILLQ